MAAGFEAWSEARAAEIVAPHLEREGPLLPILHAVQDAFGHVPQEAIPYIADRLNLSRAEVHGVVSFYHDFRTAPPGRRVLKLCRAEACQSKGGEALAALAEAELGCRSGTTRADGAVTLEAVYCLGLCSVAPSAMLDGDVTGHLDEDRIRALVDLALGPAAPSPTFPHGDQGSCRIFVPADAAALAVGADAVAEAIAGEAARLGLAVDIVRTGSRGAHFLEPMIEVETAAGRIAYGPVAPADVSGLFSADLPAGGDHPLRLGPPEAIPFLAGQTRLTFERCGIVDPRSLADYRAHGGVAGLERALAAGPAATLAAVTASGLRGRGGAGFPTGVKWKTVADTTADRKYIVCNADEGDSGTFADRMLIEGDPFVLIEGMAIAGFAVGAAKGYVYIRSEYPHAIRAMEAAIAAARGEGLLGSSVLGSGFAFDIEVRVGAGAYVCGEETALLESIEGKRGEVRAKPPLPAHKGLFGRPTVINNVISLATVPWILAHGAEAYAAFGMGRSRGTMPIQLAGNLKRTGLVEVAFGVTLGELVEEIGGGSASGRPIRAVQVGGPLGAYFPRTLFDTPFDYEAFTARDGLIGHGGIVAFDDTVDMAAQARFAFEFCALESCGKCTPCRIGSTRGVETIDRLVAGERADENKALVADLCETMKFGSLCALGGFTPYPVMSALTHFPEDFLPRGVREAAE